MVLSEKILSQYNELDTCGNREQCENVPNQGSVSVSRRPYTNVMKISPKTLFVTGGNGTIGRALVQIGGTPILRKGCSEKITDNQIYLDYENDSEHQIAYKLGGCEVIVHAMGYARNNRDSEMHAQVNLEYAKKIFMAAKIAKVKKFIFVSTTKVYGDENVSPIDKDTIAKPSCVYGSFKLKAEDSLLQLSKECNVDLCIIRVPPVISCRSNNKCSQLFKCISRARISHFLSFETKYSVIHIDDLVDIICDIIKINFNNDTIILGGICYLGSGKNNMVLKLFFSLFYLFMNPKTINSNLFSYLPDWSPKIAVPNLVYTRDIRR